MEVNNHRWGYLRGVASKATVPSELTDGHYDLAILASSWDQRCLCPLYGGVLHAEKYALILPEHRDDEGRRDAHDARLRQYIRNESLGKSCVEIAGATLDVEAMWQRLWDSVTEFVRSQQKPLRVFVDLSACARYLSLGLVAGMLRHGWARQVSVFYAEGDYPAQSKFFTTGKWTTVAVPFLSGRYFPALKRTYIVAAGWEGAKTLRVLANDDPDRVSMILPDPGVRPEYTQRAYDKNAEVMQVYCVHDEYVRKVHAGDAIGAWKATDELVEKETECNVFCLCSGTKPHSLGMALSAMALGTPAVLYNRPGGHAVVDTTPLGVYWRYDILDLSLPAA